LKGCAKTWTIYTAYCPFFHSSKAHQTPTDSVDEHEGAATAAKSVQSAANNVIAEISPAPPSKVVETNTEDDEIIDSKEREDEEDGADRKEGQAAEQEKTVNPKTGRIFKFYQYS
jgi:hypothetical protein